MRRSIGDMLGMTAAAVDEDDGVQYNEVRALFGLQPVGTELSPDTATLVEQLQTEMALLRSQLAPDSMTADSMAVTARFLQQTAALVADLQSVGGSSAAFPQQRGFGWRRGLAQITQASVAQLAESFPPGLSIADGLGTQSDDVVLRRPMLPDGATFNDDVVLPRPFMPEGSMSSSGRGL